MAPVPNTVPGASLFRIGPNVLDNGESILKD